MTAVSVSDMFIDLFLPCSVALNNFDVGRTSRYGHSSAAPAESSAYGTHKLVINGERTDLCSSVRSVVKFRFQHLGHRNLNLQTGPAAADVRLTCSCFNHRYHRWPQKKQTPPLLSSALGAVVDFLSICAVVVGGSVPRALFLPNARLLGTLFFVFGLHRSTGWFFHRRWTWRSTIVRTALLCVLFASGTARVGATHQLVWLFSGRAASKVVTNQYPGLLEQAREAARQHQAKNELKMLGLAFHKFHDVSGAFPPGGTVEP